jgi:anaerobic selenocysteine-containing dehydrogenase
VLEIHPADAQARGLNSGDTVSVWNERGVVTLSLVVTDATRAGVVYSSKGVWRKTSNTGFTVNALIPSDLRTDIEDGACYNETYVDIKKC